MKNLKAYNKHFFQIILMAIVIIASSLHPQNVNQASDDQKISWGKSQLQSIIKKVSYPYFFDMRKVKVQVNPSGEFPDESAENPGGYRILVRKGRVDINGFDAAGAMYGCLSLANIIAIKNRVPDFLDKSDAPVLKIRSTSILLMKNGTYNHSITPETFPFFYDKRQWDEYLNFLADNRFNQLVLWNAHPFDYFVRLEKYPEAQQYMKPAVLKKNNDMLKWLCRESEKRNIKIFMEFKNIHTSVYFQKFHNLPDEISEPTSLLEDYTAHSIESFVKEFPETGLYVTTGEALKLAYKPDWLSKIILPAIKRTGQTPPVVIRSWGFDLAYARDLISIYSNLFFDRKYNVDMIAGKQIDPKARNWARLNGNLIVSIHASNLEPFRWSPPAYIRQCMQSIKKSGSNGLNLFPRKPWRWPYSCDRDTSIVQWKRDEIWFKAWGRYAWNPDYNHESDREYWVNYLTSKFGNRESAEYFLEGLETSADILPAIQRLIWFGDDEHSVLNAGIKLNQLVTAPGMPFLSLKGTLQIPAYLYALREGKRISGQTPTNYLLSRAEDADKAWQLLSQASKKTTRNRTLSGFYEKDALATKYLAEFYYFKMRALESKVQFEAKIRIEKNKIAFIENLDKSVKVYQKLTELTDQSYHSLSDLQSADHTTLRVYPYHWRDVLPVFEQELQFYIEEFNQADDPRYFKPTLKGLSGVMFSDPEISKKNKVYNTNSLVFDWSDTADEFGQNWSAQWLGFLIPPESGQLRLSAESDRGVRIKIDNKVAIEWSGLETKKSTILSLEKEKPIEIEVFYDHKGGYGGYLEIKWQWPGEENLKAISAEYLYHSPDQMRQMEKSVMR